MRRQDFVRCCALAACVACSSPWVSFGQGIFVPNHDFSDPNNDGTRTGTLLSPDYDSGINNPGALPDADAPWRVRADGMVQVTQLLPFEGIVLSPTTSITSGSNGRAYISGLASTTVDPLNITLLSNSAEIYNNDIGSDFVVGQQYRLTADFFSGTFLTPEILADAGFGIGLMANGVNVGDSVSADPNLVSITLLDGNSGQISFDYTAASLINGQNIGIRLFAGQGSGLASIGLLGAVAFDNVGLAAVPEPSGLAMMGCGLAGMGIVFYRRSRRLAKQLETEAPASTTVAVAAPVARHFTLRPPRSKAERRSLVGAR